MLVVLARVDAHKFPLNRFKLRLLGINFKLSAISLFFVHSDLCGQSLSLFGCFQSLALFLEKKIPDLSSFSCSSLPLLTEKLLLRSNLRFFVSDFGFKLAYFFFDFIHL